MDNQTLLKTGIAGTVVAAVCCATPVLVILFGVLGMSAWAGWLDYVLIPALVVFIGITAYAFYRGRGEAACCPVPGNRKTRTER
ncbi:MAG: mercury resistance system transport protein MerF [Burkholderiales bacterium]